MKQQLLCTFVHKSDLDLVLDFIQQTYVLDSKKIFILNNVENPSQYYCTYNVLGNYNLTANTILIHRKSDTNTLYTINALNEVIKRMNNGVLDIDIEIPWENYQDSMLLTQNNRIIKIKLSLEKILKI